MVTPGLAVWNAATHASWAEPCDDAPVAFSVPSSAEAEGASEPAGALGSFAAQPASASAATAPMALIRAIREIFTVVRSIEERVLARCRAHSDSRSLG